jgi:uncharacterized protein YndB with AHSA1/START domain
MENFVAQASILINASPAKAWDALTNPELIKQYLFGTEAVSDWKEGSSIIYKGIWQGKAYEDKGKILKIVPEKYLKSTYWSSMSGQEDMPENYNNVEYTLTQEGESTQLTIIQDNNPTQESADHSKKNWEIVLKKLKDLLEK